MLTTLANRTPAVAGTVTDYMSRYTFDKDEAGNYIIPGEVFGGTQNVRIKVNEQNKLVLDVVQAIMAINGMSRKHARECWTVTLKEHHNLICADLSSNEGECL